MFTETLEYLKRTRNKQIRNTIRKVNAWNLILPNNAKAIEGIRHQAQADINGWGIN